MKTTNNQSIETLMGATLVWLGASNLQGEYLLESYTKATKGKAEVWLHEKASGHIITMDLSRRTLGDLQQTGEHRTDAGTTIRIKQDAERQLWISVDNGVAGDIFKEWGEAVSDLQRHVYNTLQGCCGCEIHRESATRYQAYFEDDDKWEVSEVVPFDPAKPDHREAYEAQRDRLGLPELPAIREAEGIKVGDRVKVKSQDTPADVTAISDDGQYFTVKFVRPVREFWTGNTMQTATYSRYGITRNYNRMTGEEIVGNAQYYAEQLKYGPGSIIEYEFAGVALRTESTRDDVEPDSREGWGNEYRVTIRHKSGDTIDTMTVGETAELLARLYQEAGGNMSQDFIESDEEDTLETSSEITDGAKKEPFGKMFIYRLYIKWKWMQQRFERIGDMDRAADCFYHRLRLTKLYIYQPGWRIMDYGDMKPIFFPRQRIK